jgi:hypothetical protein
VDDCLENVSQSYGPPQPHTGIALSINPLIVLVAHRVEEVKQGKMHAESSITFLIEIRTVGEPEFLL